MAHLQVIAPMTCDGPYWRRLFRRCGTRLGLAALAAALGSGAPSPGHAADLPLSDQPYGYTVLDQDLRDTLRQFGANNGLRVNVSDTVQGRVRGQLGTLAPRAFLDRLAADFGFDWFYDGFTLYATAISEGVNRLVPMNGASAAQLEDALRALGIADTRFAVRPMQGQDLMMVAGPPRFVELVQQAAMALAPKDEAKPAAPQPAPAAAAVTPPWVVRPYSRVSISPGLSRHQRKMRPSCTG